MNNLVLIIKYPNRNMPIIAKTFAIVLPLFNKNNSFIKANTDRNVSTTLIIYFISVSTKIRQ